jgi:hypothetical protein
MQKAVYMLGLTPGTGDAGEFAIKKLQDWTDLSILDVPEP